jgi:sulfatase maturation enzyme AslB (radical SAM superfamily)
MNIIKKIKGFFTRNREIPVPAYPQSILLEPTNACNLRCRMCPAYGEGVKKSRDIGFIQKDVWINAIDEIGSWPSHVNLDIHGAGEPLLHPNFFDIISYAKSKKNIIVGFLCNATLLDQKKSKAVIELDVDWVCFSVDGAEKEIFEYYRKGASLDTVEENIRNLLTLRKNGKPHISFNMVNHKEADLSKFVDKWAGLVDSLTISLKRPVLREENRRLKLLRPCPLLYQQLVIGWPGKTGLCCEDYWGDYITGDFRSESLYDIWHGKPLKRARKLHGTGRQDELYLCRTCDAILFHHYEEKIIEMHGGKTIVRKELPDIRQELAVPYNDKT